MRLTTNHARTYGAAGGEESAVAVAGVWAGAPDSGGAPRVDGVVMVVVTAGGALLLAGLPKPVPCEGAIPKAGLGADANKYDENRKCERTVVSLTMN